MLQNLVTVPPRRCAPPVPAPRRFPPPWSVDEANAACFVVKDHEGKSLAYVYFEDAIEAPGLGSSAICVESRAKGHTKFDPLQVERHCRPPSLTEARQ